LEAAIKIAFFGVIFQQLNFHRETILGGCLGRNALIWLLFVLARFCFSTFVVTYRKSRMRRVFISVRAKAEKMRNLLIGILEGKVCLL
jgi:hypothetical protein